MPTTRKPLDGLAMSLMLILCMCWGLQQVAIKVAAPSISPILQNGLRSTVAAVLVSGLMWWRGSKFSLTDGSFWPGLATGLLFAGIAVAFAGGFEAGAGFSGTLIGDALGVLAAVFWAATTIMIKRSVLTNASPSMTLWYQLVVAALALPLLALVSGQTEVAPLTGVMWASLAFQSLIVAFGSFLAWFWMLRRYLASRLTVFSFLTPLFGVSFGVLLLDDPIGLPFVFGALLVLSGIVLVNWQRG
ncbi:Permease of the drug/metabolite transporter (DMT) superfamily [Collimonas arenae]|uniref:Permease of the drug/metabolite transporter (DMT) superfamily n=1 Tax=Collimonas arenae TaxID=279058 RepID=A0A0A1FK38_9BURK|nr:DMT family transporter [Collimonas arenae]AIY44039.1 Permease of the drug/metabolite transporter (DMT) superfamily [Collimonas arenae]